MIDRPEIRFKEFTDAWEQRKVSDLLYLSGEKNDGTFNRDDVLACSLGTELQKKHIYFGLRATDESVKNYKVVENGDVVYTKSPIKGFPNGIVRTNKGESGIVPTLYCVYHCVDEVNPSIIQAYFESKQRLDAYLTPLANIGARNNVNVTDKEFLEGTICIPSNKEEQTKIVHMLESLTDAITLHQRKLDSLKQTKKYMLQKMFPKANAAVPEIRFAGYTDAWEQRKLGDLVLIERGGSPRPIDKFITNDENGLNWVKIGDAPEQGRCITKTAEKIKPEGLSKTRQVFVGDLILSNSMSFGKPYIMGINGCIHDGWLVIRNNQNKFDLKFLCHMLGTDQMLNQYKALAAGSTVNNLNKELVANTHVAVPSMEEQVQLGEYFEQLDTAITLHQRKLDILKELKKGFLQKMFPNNQ